MHNQDLFQITDIIFANQDGDIFYCPERTTKPIAYVAGPMRRKKFYNFTAFFEREALLKTQGYEVINPARIDMEVDLVNPYEFPDDHDWTHEPAGMDLERIIRRDIDGVMVSNMLSLLEEWDISTGATAERALATWRGIDVQ